MLPVSRRVTLAALAGWAVLSPLAAAAQAVGKTSLNVSYDVSREF